MAKFYRIYSRLRFDDEPPQLIIGGPPVAPTGFVEKYSDLTRSQKKAKQELKDLRRLHKFGEHHLQIVEVEEGMEVLTDKGVVKTRATQGRRR